MERLGGGQLPFSVRVDREGDSVFIALFGDLSLGYQDQFQEAMRELEREPVSKAHVDLSGLTFMDSTGLFLLLNLWKRCNRDGTEIMFEGGSPEIQGLFEATGMNHVLPVVSPGGKQRPSLFNSESALSPPVSGRPRGIVPMPSAQPTPRQP